MRYTFGVAVTVAAMPPSALVRLVNEWGTVPRRTAGEQDQPYPAAGDLDLGVPARLGDAGLRRIADLLYPVFAAPDARTRAELVTALLHQTGVRPVVAADAHGAWVVDQRRHAPVAAAALTLRDHLDRYGDARLGTCAGRDCADVYVDTSPTRDRRYCSVTCQNRARVAAYRRRHAR